MVMTKAVFNYFYDSHTLGSILLQVTGMPVVEAPLGPGQRQQGPMAARLNTLQRTSTRFAPRSAPAVVSARLPVSPNPDH